jgi:hypothetical protein
VETEETGLGFSIGFLTVPTSATGSAGVARVHLRDRKTHLCRLVEEKVLPSLSGNIFTLIVLTNMSLLCRDEQVLSTNTLIERKWRTEEEAPEAHSRRGHPYGAYPKFAYYANFLLCSEDFLPCLKAYLVP